MFVLYSLEFSMFFRRSYFSSFNIDKTKMGVILASFHSDGITPVEIVRLTRYVIGLAITGAASLRSLAVRPSRPVALVNLSFVSSFHTKLVETFWSTNFSVTLGVQAISNKQKPFKNNAFWKSAKSCKITKFLYTATWKDYGKGT